MRRGRLKREWGLRWVWPVAALAIVVIATVWWRGSALDEPEASSVPRHAGVTATRPEPLATPGKIELPDHAPPDSGPDGSLDQSPAMTEAMDVAAGWEQVDMEEVRRAMPDNLYWGLSMPSQDPNTIEHRAAERTRWNVEYGKILSGTGSEEEIRAYYDRQARLFGDYIEFTSYLLDHYREQLAERDVGLLELAKRLNLARIEELPRKVEEAMARKRQQDEARRAWRADQESFGAADPNPK